MNTCAIPGLNLRVSPEMVPLPLQNIAMELDAGVAILAGGCFWCTEAVFTKLRGVNAVMPGYAGGIASRANYDAVCTGVSGHAEVIRIEYDANLISFGKLLQVFFAVAHDATQLNRQGFDVGTQYRSSIFPVDEHQEQCARVYILQLSEANIFFAPIATIIEPNQIFYPAEKYHEKFAERNPEQAYIRSVSQPKVEKLEKYFPTLLQK